jgi:protein-tyrosine phosphatase
MLREGNEKIFIHCREGVGRAPSVAAGLLISEGVSLSDALKIVRAGRSVSDINSLQMGSLDEFESKFKSS